MISDIVFSIKSLEKEGFTKQEAILIIIASKLELIERGLDELSNKK